MATHVRIIVLVLGLALASCDQGPGGGGSTHPMPKAIAYGQTTPLLLGLSVSRERSDPISKRYTEVFCHYKPEKAESFVTLTGRIDSESKDRMDVTFDLPAFSVEDGAYVEYYFDMKLDGRYSKLTVGCIPLR